MERTEAGISVTEGSVQGAGQHSDLNKQTLF